MSSFFTNKYIQAVLVFFLVLGLYWVYVNYVQQPATTDNSMNDMGSTNMESMENTGSSEPASENSEVDYTGTHIMPNGDVMTGGGEVIPDAVINLDGSVTLPNGTVLPEVIDMR